MNFKLRIWRQKDRQSPGKLVDYDVRDISPHTSLLEMLDILNEELLGRAEEPRRHLRRVLAHDQWRSSRTRSSRRSL
jgi:hypothetical protein